MKVDWTGTHSKICGIGVYPENVILYEYMTLVFTRVSAEVEPERELPERATQRRPVVQSESCTIRCPGNYTIRTNIRTSFKMFTRKLKE